jgi:hypothetical protein
MVEIEWIVPPPTPRPFAPPERVLAFRPGKAEVARLTFDVVDAPLPKSGNADR